MNKDKHCLIIRLTILLFFSLFVLDGSEFQQPLVAFFPSASDIKISPPTWWSFALANSAPSWCSFASLRLSNYSNSETARFRNSHPFSNTLPTW